MTSTGLQPAIVSVSSACRIQQDMSQQVVALGRRRSHGSIPIGIDESDLYTLDTSWPDGQINLHDGRKSARPAEKHSPKVPRHTASRFAPSTPVQGPNQLGRVNCCLPSTSETVPFRFDEMSKKEINVQLSNADPDDPPCRPMRDLSGRSGRAIAVSRDPLSPIALDASKVSIVGLRQQLVNGCTRTVGDDDHPLRIT